MRPSACVVLTDPWHSVKLTLIVGRRLNKKLPEFREPVMGGLSGNSSTTFSQYNGLFSGSRGCVTA